MYALDMLLSQVHPSKSDGYLVNLNQAAVEGLAGVDKVILDYNPRIPGLYVIRPAYRVPARESWKDIGAVLKDKHGDCKDLTAWRLAELWVMGVPARAESIVERQGTRLLFHTYVRYPDGRVEDPSRELGMR